MIQLVMAVDIYMHVWNWRGGWGVGRRYMYLISITFND